jgi:N-acetylneuraminate synthase
MTEIKLGNILVGDGHPCYVVAEIGINHNGSIEIAKKLIDVAVSSRCQAVKFQKRTVDVVYSPDELARLRESPFGTTNGDLKYGLEFGSEQYREIDQHCKELNISWFASCWDEASVDFIDKFNVPCFKIASASLTDDNLLKYTRAKGRPILLSTGMSTLEQIDHAVEILGKKDLILLHTCSTYPAGYEELNLRVIPMLHERFGIPIGYSGHETGLSTTIATIPLGACVVERHITLDRAMWGSDQAASVEPQGFGHMVRDIRLVETALGDGSKHLGEREEAIMKKLRRVDSANGGNVPRIS